MARKKKVEEEVTEIPLVSEDVTTEVELDFDFTDIWNMLIHNRQGREVISYIARNTKNAKILEILNTLPNTKSETVLEKLGIITSDAQKYFIQELAKEHSLVSSLARTNSLFDKYALSTDSYQDILKALA